MSFYRLPKVDNYAKNEAESRNALKQFFQEKNGFACSTVDRDMGNDFLFELITEKGATNWHFPVQLKSIETPVMIQNGRFISYTFPLHTLRYQLMFVPTVSIIVFYLVKNKQLYYDYAESIYSRLIEVNNRNNNWKEQESAKIHIPITNILNEESCKNIHRDILERYKNMPGKFETLFFSLYNPIKLFNNEKIITKNPIKDAVEILMKEGLTIYYNHDIRYLNKLINTLPNKIVSESSFLSLLAGITFHEMRMLVDARYFLEKALANKNITPEHHRHARWAKMFNDLEMGKVNNQQIKEQIDELRKDTPAEEELTLIQYELTIVRNEIENLNSLEKEKFMPFVEQFDIFQLRLKEIHSSSISKAHYKLLNAINLSLLIQKFHSKILRGINVLEKRGDVVRKDVKEAATIFIANLTNKFVDTINDIIYTTSPAGEYILLSRVYETYVCFRVTTELNYLEVNLKRIDFGEDEHAQQISHTFGLANVAFQYFFKEEYFGSAYNTLLMMFELREIATYYNIKLSGDFEELENRITFLQERLNVAPKKLHSIVFITRNRQLDGK